MRPIKDLWDFREENWDYLKEAWLKQDEYGSFDSFVKFVYTEYVESCIDTWED